MAKKPAKKKSAKKGAIKGAKKGVTPTRRRKKPDHNKFSIFIYKVLQQVHPGTGMSKKAMVIMNELIHDVFDRIASEAGKLCKYNGKSTLRMRDIETAVRLILPGQLAKHAVSEGTKYVMRCFSGPSGAGYIDRSETYLYVERDGEMLRIEEGAK